MSRRNYKPSEGSLGKFRHDVPTPETLPVINTDAVLNLMDWRAKRYHRPFLDDLLGYYTFPATKSGVEAYTQKNPVKPVYPTEKAIGREAIRELIEARKQAERDAIDKTERKKLHIAESAEKVTALFLAVAKGRKAVISDVIASINDGTEFNPGSVVYAADAIADLGACLEEPYDHDYRNLTGPGRKTPQGLSARIESIAPDAGRQLVSFGSYASNNPEVLRSYEGVTALTAASDEQDYRISTWQPRHEVLFQVYPELEPSTDVITLKVPLGDMLQIQDDMRQ